MDMNLSEEGLVFLKKKEGVRNRVYDDGAGYPTVGVGHKLIGQELEQYKLGSFVPDCQVDAWLRQDVEFAVRCVNNWVVVSLSQTGFDMLVSFVFNVGCEAFKKSTLLRQLNRGQIKEASEEFKKWVFSNKKRMAGLVARRAEEAETFLKSELERPPDHAGIPS
jgi:lysozyme